MDKEKITKPRRNSRQSPAPQKNAVSFKHTKEKVPSPKLEYSDDQQDEDENSYDHEEEIEPGFSTENPLDNSYGPEEYSQTHTYHTEDYYSPYDDQRDYDHPYSDYDEPIENLPETKKLQPNRENNQKPHTKIHLPPNLPPPDRADVFTLNRKMHIKITGISYYFTMASNSQTIFYAKSKNRYPEKPVPISKNRQPHMSDTGSDYFLIPNQSYNFFQLKESTLNGPEKISSDCQKNSNCFNILFSTFCYFKF